MRHIVMVAILWMGVRAGFANEEMTVELPGGATMEFVWIEPGTFMMGTTTKQEQLLRDEGLWDEMWKVEQPVHEVTLTRGFWLGKFEITQAQWVSVMETQPWAEEDLVQENPNHPAVYISWNDLQTFIQRLNEVAEEEVYRLPTEAEWEYAARAGTTTRWSFGEEESQLGDYAWYTANTCDRGACYAHAVGTKLPNPWRLYDIHGNVFEWVQDWFYVEYYSISPQVDPLGPADFPGGFRGARGGVFFEGPPWSRSACRFGGDPDASHGGVGARLLRMGLKITPIAPESWGQIKAGPEGWTGQPFR